MDSSESPVHGQQEGVAYNGHFESVCYHPLFLFAGITHIKLPGSKQRTILNVSHRSISHGCRQPSNQAHKTISRRGELAAPGSGGGFHHVCTPFKLLRARTSPLVASLHL